MAPEVGGSSPLRHPKRSYSPMVKASVSQTEDSRFESECDHQGEKYDNINLTHYFSVDCRSILILLRSHIMSTSYNWFM